MINEVITTMMFHRQYVPYIHVHMHIYTQYCLSYTGIRFACMYMAAGLVDHRGGAEFPLEGAIVSGDPPERESGQHSRTRPLVALQLCIYMYIRGATYVRTIEIALITPCFLVYGIKGK